MSEFEKYARNHCGISSLKLHDFQSVSASYVSPTIIEERQLNIATMDVFSRLMMDRIIFLGAPIYDDAANIIQAQLLFLESVDPEKDIQIYINSPGGSVSAGLGIYDTMQLVNSDVATICTGLAASMGAVLLTAGAKGKRSALPHSRVMIHQPLGGAQGQASDIEITAREIMKTKRELYEILAAHSGVSVRKIEKDADRDYWLSAREALRSILTEPKNAIVKQYKRLFELDGVKLSFDEAVLDYIVDKAVEFKLGARGLRSICEAIMMDTMFDIPSTDARKFTVTLPYAKKKIEKANILELKQVG